VAASAIAASPKVELRDVNLRYFGLEGETEALKGISIAVAPGEMTCARKKFMRGEPRNPATKRLPGRL